jgi:hypothetical protein
MAWLAIININGVMAIVAYGANGKEPKRHGEISAMNRNKSGSQYVAAWRRNNGVSKYLQRASKMAKTIESNRRSGVTAISSA